MDWQPADNRYETMIYNRCGRSGLKLPAISLGLWHNFGDDTPHQTEARDLPQGVRPRHHPFRPRQQLRPAARLGRRGLRRNPAHRFRRLSRRADHLDQGRLRDVARALRRMGQPQISARQPRPEPEALGLDYVDIFYSHRFDPDTPLEETMMALDHAVRSGKALYVGISSYNSQRTREAATILRELGTPCLIHQPSYSMINRWVEEDGLLDTLEGLGIGSIVFSPLAQGMLTDKYLQRHSRRQPRRAGQVARPGLPQRRERRQHPRAQRDRRAAAARRWRRWRSPGCCAAAASPRR